MLQKIGYDIKFSFNSQDFRSKRVLPKVELFLQSLEDADCLMSASLDLEANHNRMLKEIDKTHFSYSVTLFLDWPQQIVLGYWPKEASMALWMAKVRQDIFANLDNFSDKNNKATRQPSVDSSGMVRQWNIWAEEEGLTKPFVYKPLISADLFPLLGRLGEIIGNLGDVDCT